MSRPRSHFIAAGRALLVCLLAGFCFLPVQRAQAHEPLVGVVARIKGALVGIAPFAPLSNRATQLSGTGFAVGDGSYIITNAHVVEPDDPKIKQALIGIVPVGLTATQRTLTLVATDPVHDLALLKIDGPPLEPVMLHSEPTMAADGAEIAATGFPIGAVLGPVPSTVRGIVSARTPNISPQPTTRTLDSALLSAPRFLIYQLDLTVYPGYSGSPLYLSGTGEVIGIINATRIKSTKERVISDPSGISYAIPSTFIRALMARHNVPDAATQNPGATAARSPGTGAPALAPASGEGRGENGTGTDTRLDDMLGTSSAP